MNDMTLSIDEQRVAKQNRIREYMPLFVKGQGVWEGVYRHLDPEGKIVDQHKSKLITHFATAGKYAYHQCNIYTWDSGKKEQREFWVDWRDDTLIYDNDLIKGYFRHVTEDHAGLTLLGHWRRHGLNGVYFYEMIQRSPCGNFRTRTWQWIKDEGGVFRRTLIDERKVSEDWESALAAEGISPSPGPNA